LKKVKVKFILEEAIKAQRAVKGMDLLCLFSALDEMGRLINVTPRPLCPPVKRRGTFSMRP
jgi:hypothetical protein